MTQLSSPAIVLLPTLVLLAASARSCHALYEDQAGSFDWHQQLLGPISRAALHGTKPRAFIGSTQNVVGSLNLRDGSIAWRKQLEERLDSVLLLDRPALLVSVSQGGNILRAWDQSEGGLRWEVALGPSRAASVHAAHAVSTGQAGQHGEECQLAVATPIVLKVLRCKDGGVVASSALTATQDADVVHVHHALGRVEAHTHSAGWVAYAYSAGSELLQITSLLFHEGDHGLHTRAVPSPGVALSAVSAVGAAGFVALSADYSQLCSLGVEDVDMRCQPIASLGTELAPGPGLRLVATTSGFVLYSSAKGQPGAALFKLPSEGVTLVKYVPAAALASAPVPASGGEAVAFVETTSSGSILIQALHTATGDLLWNDKVTAPRSAAVPQAGGTAVELAGAYLGTYKKKDKGDGYRLVVAWEDGHVAMLQQGTSVWSRSEALGAVIASHFVDLPVPAKAAAAGTRGGVKAGAEACEAGDDGGGSCPAAPAAKGFDLERFVKMQLLSFKVQFKMNTPAEAAELMRLREEASERTAPFRDANGFRKLIVCLTQAGTVAALHNGDGHIVWSHHYSPSALGAPTQLLPWRMYHDLAHAPQLLVLRLGQGAPAYASILDAHSGRELQNIPLPGATYTKALPVNERLVDGHAEQSVYLLVAPEGAGAGAPAVQLLPDTPQSRAWFTRQHRSLYFWLHDAETNTLTGYGFGAEAGAAVAAGASLIPALKVWELAPSEPILGVTARDPSHAVQSSVKVLGDRSIKYKYLNPNTLVLALGHTPDTLPSHTSTHRLSSASYRGDEDEDGSLSPAVTLVVLDTATGRVLHSQVQTGALGPVRLAMSENMVAAEMWDTVTRRMTIVSMDLFDATPREFSVLDYLFNPNSTQPISSFDRAPLEVLSQAYWTRAPSRFLAYTTTQQGITSKQLLAGMLTDQLYGMDARLLDPRRPRRQKLTQQEQEERLIPYQEFLPLVPAAMLSYDHQILGLSRVTVQPSRLESTCLIFANGVDLYYTRLAPARKYDSLEDDFAYGLLVVALLGLGVGAAVMRRMTKRTMLEQKWK